MSLTLKTKEDSAIQEQLKVQGKQEAIFFQRYLDAETHNIYQYLELIEQFPEQRRIGLREQKRLVNRYRIDNDWIGFYNLKKKIWYPLSEAVRKDLPQYQEIERQIERFIKNNGTYLDQAGSFFKILSVNGIPPIFLYKSPYTPSSLKNPVLFAGKLSQLYKQLAQNYPQNSSVYFLCNEKRFVYTLYGAHEMEKQVEEFYLNSYRTNTNDTVTAVVERVAFGGHDFFVLIQPLPIPGKKIALVHPAATILTAFQTLRTSFLIGAFIALILLFLVNFYANVRLFKPLQHLIKIACDAPQEDFKILSSGKKRSEIKCMLEILNKSLTQFKALNKINIDKIISERKKLEHIIEQMVGGILIIDPENRIIICNNLFAQWHNLDKRNLINKKLSEITGLNMYQDMINNLIWEKSSEIKQQRILLDSGKNGINRTLEANATNIFTSGKTFIATSIYVRDITKEHEIDKLKSELVSTVAHELRSPIVSIIGFSEILLEDTIKENEHKEYLRIIQKESSRLSAFIDNFLDLTRIESGTMPLNKKESDFNKTVKQVLNLYKSQAMQKSIRFKTYFEKPVFVHKYDTFLIERVIGNYLSNAIKYSQPYTFISVKTYSKEGHLYFEVIDNGIGISESDLEKIFDKFYRVPVKNDDMPKGSGLGLSFVKEAIAKHEGDVFVRSKLGEGSIFGFKLPLDIE